jgi:cell pole-organizing protein PopZ
VLVLDDSMMVEAADSPGIRASTPVAPVPAISAPPVPVVIDLATPEPAVAPRLAEPPAQRMEIVAAPEQPAPHDQSEPLDLVAPEAAAAAASSVGNLMRTLAAGRATQVYSGGPTLEDMVRAELRPLLKDWLDTNLPPVVERLVRAEIERVVARAVP